MRAFAFGAFAGVLPVAAMACNQLIGLTPPPADPRPDGATDASRAPDQLTGDGRIDGRAHADASRRGLADTGTKTDSDSDQGTAPSCVLDNATGCSAGNAPGCCSGSAQCLGNTCILDAGIGSADAGIDSPAPCNDVVPTGPVVSNYGCGFMESPPPPAGGTVVDGTYNLTSVVDYTCQYGDNVGQMTLDISDNGASAQLAFVAISGSHTSPTSPSTYALATNNDELEFFLMCGLPPSLPELSLSPSYTATSTTLALYYFVQAMGVGVNFVPAGWIVYSYTLAPSPDASP